MALEVQNLRTLNGSCVTFRVSAGQCVALTGPSGSGKSLVLRAIADLDQAEGSVVLNGRAREAYQPTVWRQLVRYLPPVSQFWTPHLAGHFAKDMTSEAEKLGLSAHDLTAPIERLSTGQRQRGAIMRAMSNQPKVLLLDEPTSALDAVSIDRVEGMLREFMAQGGAIVLVTHDQAQAQRMSESMIELVVKA
ncbi:ATP-binding cassette domain-containing protein [Falsihalocynthiibacter sp. S25ZX9]|uniref:ABC transporter ATP-binding protein n=1 Tax=Falsihalocynthiibacter sp. S25ZX9 TaxID=3240870 RepID=UPI00350F5FF8